MSPIRIGCQFQAFRGRTEFLDTARKLEASGFDVATFPDHLGGWLGMWPAIVGAASVTSTLRLGPMTVNNELWNPIVLARDAVSADVLSGGRLELGLGAGWRDADTSIAGIAPRPPGERIARLGETVEILRSYFGGGAFEFEGKFHRADVPAERMLPAQTHVPIFIGGGGRRILRLAATAADILGVHINLGSSEYKLGTGSTDSEQGVEVDALERRLAWIAHDRLADLPSPELHVFVLDLRVGATALAAAEEIAPNFGITPAQVVASPWFLTGSVAEIAAKIAAVNERYGISYFTVVEEHADTMADVIALLRR